MFREPIRWQAYGSYTLKGFDEPLQEGMVLAVEPKVGIPGVGMVGVENTFVVTPAGGVSITGDGREIRRV